MTGVLLLPPADMTSRGKGDNVASSLASCVRSSRGTSRLLLLLLLLSGRAQPQSVKSPERARSGCNHRRCCDGRGAATDSASGRCRCGRGVGRAAEDRDHWCFTRASVAGAGKECATKWEWKKGGVKLCMTSLLSDRQHHRPSPSFPRLFLLSPSVGFLQASSRHKKFFFWLHVFATRFR